MDYIAVFDIGTTSIKGMLIDEKANICGANSIVLNTHYGAEGTIEQDPMDWWSGVKEIASKWWNEDAIEPSQVKQITLSGQMEDVIPIRYDKSNDSAILYSDRRAKKESEYIHKKFSNIRLITGNEISASTPLAKLLWLEENQRQEYNQTDCFVFNAKDFVIFKLTDVFATDPTTAATTGMMNVKIRQWDLDILSTFNIARSKLPTLYNAEEIVGSVTASAAMETGFLEATPVLCGCGDAGASTMGAAAVREGDSYFYIGTTGWAAVIKQKVNSSSNIEGIFHLAHLPKDKIIAIAPLLNVGNVHNWAVNTFVGQQEGKYEMFEERIAGTTPGSNGIVFLPYLNGERCPFNDVNARGAFWGIGPNTEKNNMERAVIEGICFSLKQLIESLVEEKAGTITLIGGGAKSAVWCQILADCIGRPIRVPTDSEYMPAIGASASGFIHLGWASDYEDFVDKFLIPTEAKIYYPSEKNIPVYEEGYKKFLKLYPSLTNMYMD